MTPKWQRRFLTWGIIIAVFGMRIVFPLAIVAIAAWIGPDRRHTARDRRARRIFPHHARGPCRHRGLRRHLPDDGGPEILLRTPRRTCTGFTRWRAACTRYASMQGIEIGFVLVLILIFSHQLAPDDAATFMISALYGLLTFLGVDVAGQVARRLPGAMNTRPEGRARRFPLSRSAGRQLLLRRRHRRLRADARTCSSSPSGSASARCTFAR